MHTGTDGAGCVGVVLAGGRSRRMGRDKAMLDWHGEALLEHQISVLRGSGLAEVKVSGYRPQHAGIEDLRAAAGPLAGIASVATGLADGTDLLVVPVDMPLLSPELVHRLRSEAAGAACVCFDAHVLPLRLRIDQASRTVLMQHLGAAEARGRSLRAMLQALAAIRLPLTPGEAEQLFDCNTPERWSRALARIHRPPAPIV